MKPFTIEEIIRIIYHDNPTERDKLLAEYPTYDAPRKADVTQIISDQYLSLYDDLAILKYEQFMDEVSTGIRQISTTMMQEAYRAVHEDLAQILTGKHQDNQKIQAIQQKIQALASN